MCCRERGVSDQVQDACSEQGRSSMAAAASAAAAAAAAVAAASKRSSGSACGHLESSAKARVSLPMARGLGLGISCTSIGRASDVETVTWMGV